MSSAHAWCFACGGRNAQGLQLKFRPAGASRVSADCILGGEYQGYPGVVQGGIVATLLDSAMTNCLFAGGIEAMTARLSVRFREPVYVNRNMTVEARIVLRRGGLHKLEASVVQDDTEKATAEGCFLCSSDESAMAREVHER